MDNKEFFRLCLVCVVLYYVFLWGGNFFRKRRRIKEQPVKDYISKVIASINRMNGFEFEDFVSFVLRDIGYSVRQTKKTKDGGKDIILKTDKGKTYVETKRYNSKNLITSPHILKLIGSATSDGVNSCLFITTSGYTKDAIDLAEKSKVKVKLMDLEDFIDVLKQCNSSNVLRYLGH